MAKSYFITGIGTGIGKTVVSAVVTEKLKADYWKPIQSGDLAQSDSLTVESLISNKLTKIHPERYRLNHPLSPHLSAKLDGIEIDINQLQLPVTTNHLIIEGAGGLMVPLNDEHLLLDFIKSLNIEVIVVCANYLGSINHTLLTLNTLKQHQVKIKGLIFNGIPNTESERYILNYSGVKLLGHIPQFSTIEKSEIIKAGEQLSI